MEKSMSQSVFLSENYSYKPSMKDGFSSLASSTSSSSSKGTNFFQDFYNFDRFNANGSSLNPIFRVQTGSNFDSFDAFPYGSSVDLYDDYYECKPFTSNQAVDIFQNGAYLMNFSQRNNDNNNPLDHTVGSNNYIQDHMALNFQEIKPMNHNLSVPDEVSSITANNHGCQKEVGATKVFSSARRTWKGRKKNNNIVKGQWTIDEDRLLSQLVEQYGIRKWSRIAQMLPGRIGKQCRERWHNHLRPNIKKDIWSEEEDKILIQAHVEMGNKWAEIAKRLAGRTENSIKNHWNATKRRQYSKRKCRSKYPRGSLLQDYIKSLNLDSCQQPAAGRFSNKDNNKTTDHHDHATESSELDSRSEKLAETKLLQQPDQLVGFSSDIVPDFGFDERLILFQDGYGLDSLLGEIPNCDNHHDHQDVVDVKGFDMDVGVVDQDGNPLMLMMDFEVKKELDLVEMISQAKM